MHGIEKVAYSLEAHYFIVDWANNSFYLYSMNIL